MRQLFDGWAILSFLFWMGFCWLLCYRRIFWGSVKKNVVTSLLLATLGCTIIYLSTLPVVNTLTITKSGIGHLPPSKYNSEILHLAGSMCLILALAFRIILQPVPLPNPRVLVSDSNVFPISGTKHIIDEVRVRLGDIIILINQNRSVENGPWEVRKNRWRRPESNPRGSHTFGSWLIANCGSKYAQTLWMGSLCRNDIISEGDSDWKQIASDSRIRTFASLDIPCNIGETAKFLLKVGVLPHQIMSSTQEDVIEELRVHGHISPTAVGILLHKPYANRDSQEWGPRVKATMRLLIHSGEFEYAKDAYASAVTNGFEHYMTEAEVRTDLEVRIRNEITDHRPPTRFERDEVI